MRLSGLLDHQRRSPVSAAPPGPAHFPEAALARLSGLPDHQ
ncbi:MULTISPECIES: hypothetical protein [Enterobacteriaceae]|nr:MULTISPECIES: hypothetical protein [Enterobacteriaceae]